MAKRKKPKPKTAKPKAAEPDKPAPPPRDPLAQVLQWVLDGQSERDIVAAIKSHWPDTDPPVIIAAVVASIEKSAGASQDFLIGWCLEATRELCRRMIEIGDFPGALRAVKQTLELSRHVRSSGTEADDEPTPENEGELREAQAEGSGAPT